MVPVVPVVAMGVGTWRYVSIELSRPSIMPTVYTSDPIFPLTQTPKFLKQAALRASRARPSLLVPLAGSVGFGLRCLTQLVPGTAPVAKGVLGSIEAAMDDGVRALIQMEQQQEGAAATAAAVKGLLKARRDGVAAAAGGEGGEGEAVGVGGNPLAQGTQLVCRALLKGAEKL